MSAVYAVVFVEGPVSGDAPGAVPIVLRELAGVPVLVRSLERLLAHPDLDSVVVACPEQVAGGLEPLLRIHGIVDRVTVVPAGDAVDASIHDGLAALRGIAGDDDVVVIHDAARPLIDGALISANIAAARDHRAAVTVGPATEGVVRVVGDVVVQVHPADGQMFLTKTPQTFRYGVIWDLYAWAHATPGAESSSPAHLCSFSGVKPHVVLGGTTNIRIVDDVDLEMGLALLAASGAETAGGRA